MESTPSLPEPKRRLNWKKPFQQLFDNPVILKELRGRMRGGQAFVLLTVYLGLIALFILMVYNIVEVSGVSSWDPSAREGAGKAIFGTVVLLELLLLSFIAPGLTSGAITAERERQTYDLLKTTLISARSLVLGKLGSAFSFLFLLILTAIPIQSIAFLLGGVGVGEMVVSGLMLVVTALFFCTLGIFFSSLVKRTLAATISSYAAILLSFLGLVVIFFMIVYIESMSGSVFGRASVREYMLISFLWFLISINPLMSAVMSEVILVDQQNLFYTTSSIFGSSGPAVLPSPWTIYVAVYSLLTVVLILWSIHNVNKPDKS